MPVVGWYGRVGWSGKRYTHVILGGKPLCGYLPAEGMELFSSLGSSPKLVPECVRCVRRLKKLEGAGNGQVGHVAVLKYMKTCR